MVIFVPDILSLCLLFSPFLHVSIYLFFRLLCPSVCPNSRTIPTTRRGEKRLSQWDCVMQLLSLHSYTSRPEEKISLEINSNQKRIYYIFFQTDWIVKKTKIFWPNINIKKNKGEKMEIKKQQYWVKKERERELMGGYTSIIFFFVDLISIWLTLLWNLRNFGNA